MVGFPTPDVTIECSRRPQALGEPLTSEIKATSSRPSPSTLSVGYAPSPPENRWVRRSSATAEPWPSSPLDEERSAPTASLGLERDTGSRHDSRATWRLRGTRHCRGRRVPVSRQGHNRRTSGCCWRCSRGSASGACSVGIVQSGQSDIEATSGADLVSPRFRWPYMLTFQSWLLTTHFSRLGRAETHPPHERRAACPSLATDRQTGPDETITGRTQPANAPTGVRGHQWQRDATTGVLSHTNPTASATSCPLTP